MHAGPQYGREAWIAGHYQGELVSPADPGEIPPKCRAVGGIVMPKHHAADPLRQAGNGGTRIRQPHRVGEQP